MPRTPIHALVCGDLNLLRCLIGRGIPVAVVASDAREPTLRSRHATRTFMIAPSTDAEQAVADLEKLAERFVERPVLYYGNDATLLMISRARGRLIELFRFSLPPSELVETLVDKALFAELARERRLPVPETIHSEQVESAEELLAHVGLPCCFKPTNHTGWLSSRAHVDRLPKKALRADTPEQARSLYDELSRVVPFVVQRWVEGNESSVFSFHCYADESSRILGWFVGRKIRTYPKEAGVSTYLELVRDPEVAKVGAQIVSQLGIVGPLKIDFKRDTRSGELYLLELNPRFTLWCYLGAAAGVNLPAIAYASLSGLPTPPLQSYRTDIRWLSFENDVRAFLRSYYPSGDLGMLEWLGSFRSKKVYEVFSWTDPAPSAAKTLDYLKRAAKRILLRRRAAEVT